MAQMNTLVLNGEVYQLTDSQAVHHTAQALSDAQKAQTRKNIGAVGQEVFQTEYSPNLLDLSAVADNALLDSNGIVCTGAIYENYKTTAKIPCKPGDILRHQFDWNGTRYDNTTLNYANMEKIAAYDAQDNFIAGSYKINAFAYTVPEGAAFVRISYDSTKWGVTYTNNAILIQEDATVVPFMECGAVVSTKLSPEVQTESIHYTQQALTDEQKACARGNIQAVGMEDIFQKVSAPNLLDLNTISRATQLGTDGKTYAGSQWDLPYITTAHIPCQPGDKIRYQLDYRGVRYDNTGTPSWLELYGFYRVCAYDAAGAFVSAKDNQKCYEVPEGVASVRITLEDAKVNTGDYSNNAIIIQDDATVQPFRQYGETIVRELNPDLDQRSIVLYSQQALTDAEKEQVRANIGAAGEEAILCTGQSLTEAQKAQARANIGAAGIGEGGVVESGAVLYTPQTIADSQKAQARANIGALGAVAPRAQIRQIKAGLSFADIYVPADWNYSTYPEQYYRDRVFGLAAHSSTGTQQKVYESLDGGETWSEYCALPMDAANGVWYTDFAVDYGAKCVYALKTTDGLACSNNALVSFFYYETENRWVQRDNEISLGKKRWLTNNSFEIFNYNGSRIAMFGEYGTTTDGTCYCLWRSANGGATWSKVLEIVGDDNTSGSMVYGEIRHWHTVKADPHTGDVWAATGDTDAQCKIYRSTAGGEKGTWELLFAGSQRERTCGFVFEEDCIYYGMDARDSTDPAFTKIVRIDRSKLETDRENCREDVATVDSSRSVYGLTRTFYPDGFLVWTQQEPGAGFADNQLLLQFYDYATKKLYPVAVFDISNISKSKYIGFYAGAKCQCLASGNIFAKPTISMHQEKYGFWNVSSHIKINLTM